VSAKDAFFVFRNKGQKKRTKIIKKNSANKSQKQPRVRGAGKIMSACCDNHTKCTHTVGVDKMQDFLNPKQLTYTVNSVFLYGVWCCNFLFER